MNNTNIVNHVKEKFKGFSLIEGSPSPDLIATIATRYLVDNLKMKKVAHIESPGVVPIVRVNNGLTEHPIRIYVSKKHKLLVLLSDQVITPNQIFGFSESIIDWSEKKKVKRIISLAGMAPNENAQSIVGASNTIEASKLLKKNKIPILKTGLISGVSAELLILAKNIDCLILLANPKNTTNFDSAANLLKLLSKMFNFEIDLNPLKQESKKIIVAIKEKMQQMQKQQTAKKENTKSLMFT